MSYSEFKFRGHLIYEGSDGEWYFFDDNEPVATTHNNRPCGFCYKKATKEGYDGCLGCLPDVRNACCGHGHDRAYVQFTNGYTIRGLLAHQFFREIKE